MKNYTDVINDINAGTTADALSLSQPCTGKR